MKFLNSSDDLKELESKIRNKFRWEWMEKEDFSKELIKLWCKKIDVAGSCFCCYCNLSLRYSSEGFKSLFSHSATAHHIKAYKAVKNTQFLHSDSSDGLQSERVLDLATRKCRSDALITSFIAEHSLPFSIAPNILDLAKTLSKDLTSLNSLQMGRSSATYKLKYGLAKTVKEEQFDKLKHAFFSLNIDESTNKANESVLAILVQYYCEEDGKVVIRHLASVKLEACNSNSIYNEIVTIVEENKVPWTNLVSVLMDSCNTMRGVKNGVEIQLKTKKAPHLLDIDGDTCHTINNCAKKFTAPFLKHVETLCDSIYFDLKSADKRELFFKLCLIIGVKCLKPLSRPDHRWLYVLIVLERIEHLWDVLVVFYFSWIPSREVEIYKEDMQAVFEQRGLSGSQIKEVESIQSKLRKKNLTQDGKKRKQKIIKLMFVEKLKTLLQIGIYKTVLPHFNQYLKFFQSKAIFLHLLHFELFDLTKQFLTFFLKHEIVSKIEYAQDLLNINVNEPDNFLSDALLYTGADVSKLLKNSKKNNVHVKEFRKTLREAYSKCAEYMLQKLPLQKSAFVKFTGLDPELRGQTDTFNALKKLAHSLPNVIPEEESSELDRELRLYQVDSALKAPAEKLSIEKFWFSIFQMKQGGEAKYPYLSKLVKAVLTCFQGPHVESAFNHMGNIMTSNRTSLNIDGLDSVQTMKYYLISKEASTSEVFGSTNPAYEPIDKAFRVNLLKSRAYYHQSLESKNLTNDSCLNEKISDQNEKTPSSLRDNSLNVEPCSVPKAYKIPSVKHSQMNSHPDKKSLSSLNVKSCSVSPKEQQISSVRHSQMNSDNDKESPSSLMDNSLNDIPCSSSLPNEQISYVKHSQMNCSPSKQNCLDVERGSLLPKKPILSLKRSHSPGKCKSKQTKIGNFFKK